MTLVWGRIRYSRCQALSKLTKRQCGALTISGKRVCVRHSGLSYGPVSADGRGSYAKAKTDHGGETKIMRAARPAWMAELKVLEKIIEK